MNNFSEILPSLGIDQLCQRSVLADESDFLSILDKGKVSSLEDFAVLLSPEGRTHIEKLAVQSQAITRRHFGNVIRLFAPLYLSNECVNICSYCGFSRNNDIPRITLPVSQVEDEVSKLAKQGIRSLLIVAGEHPKYVSNGYVEECIKQSLRYLPSIALELGPMETEGYLPLVQAGCESLIVYQETYHKETYKEHHIAGPKKNYDWRLDCAERAYEAGFRRLGIGALFGLYDWRHEAISLAAHALHLTRKCWKAQISISFPRMRPASGEFQPKNDHLLGDKDFVQFLCALRMMLPHAAFTLSTRESPLFRDGLMSLGITTMSAGSCTEPGGYSEFDETTWSSENQHEGEQFSIADERSPAEVAQVIKAKGMEPVWKDLDQSLVVENKQTRELV